jgi:hypothetical protein
MYDQVAVAEISLINTGLVGFDFTAMNMDPDMSNKPKPGVPVMTPHSVRAALSSIAPIVVLMMTKKDRVGMDSLAVEHWRNMRMCVVRIPQHQMSTIFNNNMLYSSLQMM